MNPTANGLHATYLQRAAEARKDGQAAEARRRVHNARVLRTGEGRLELPPLPREGVAS